MSSTERPPLQYLLSKAVRAPNCIYTDDGGAVLALSLHCLFIEAGFINNLKRGKPYPPQKDWNRNRDAWIFQYTKTGYANTFTLACGLKKATSQAYVHVTEDNGGDNVSFMGLLLHKYIPDTKALKQDNWQGVVANEETLTSYFDSYIMQPVLNKAVPLFEDDEPFDEAFDEAFNGRDGRVQLSAAGLMAVLIALSAVTNKAKQQAYVE